MTEGLYDIHCHILPGVDDGAKDMEEACWMLQREYEQGVRHIIATPHFRYEMFETSVNRVKEQFYKLQEKALQMGMELYLGCELHSSMDMADCLRRGERLTMAESRYVLTEFRYGAEKKYIRERVQKMKSSGYIPIVAHIERYDAVRKDMEFIGDLRRIGGKIQVNADSITGKEGFMTKHFCKKLMKEDLLDFIGTDGHGQRKRIPTIKPCYELVEKSMGEAYARRIFVENPRKITG